MSYFFRKGHVHRVNFSALVLTGTEPSCVDEVCHDDPAVSFL